MKVDLVKLLKKGDKVYTLVQGKMMKVQSIEPEEEFPIKVGSFNFNRQGSILKNGTDCLLFPNEEDKTWENYSPFKKGEIVLVYNDDQEKEIGVFSHKKDGSHYLFKGFGQDGFIFEGFDNCEYIDLGNE